MKKILLMSLLVSTSSLFVTHAFARGEYDGSQRIIDLYAPPKVIYVVPAQQGYNPPPQPAIAPSTYVAPTNNWESVIVSPPPAVNFDPYE